MSTQVGEGYIEIEPRFNRDVFARMSTLAGRNMAAGFNRSFSTSVNKDIRGAFNRAFDNVNRDVDRHTTRINKSVGRKIDRDSDRWGRTMGRHIGLGLEGVISLLPARLESLFTRTGPVLGTIFITGFIAAAALSLPALGAMVSGALFASIGFGAAIAAAVVGAIDDPRVSSAVDRLKKKFMDVTVYAPAIQSLGATLAKNLDKVTAALSRWAPHIQGILKAGEGFMSPMFDAFIKSMDILLPTLNRLANSGFMKDLMGVMNSGIVKIFEAFAISFNRFLADPQAMEGATKGLELFFNLVAATIKTIFDLLRWLSRLYARMSGEGGLFDKIRGAWKVLRDAINEVGGAAKDAWKAVGGGGILQTIGAMLAPVVDFIKNEAVPPFKEFAKEIWEKLQPKLKEWGRIIREEVQPALKRFGEEWDKLWPKIKPIAEFFMSTAFAAGLIAFSVALEIVTIGLQSLANGLWVATFFLKLFGAQLDFLKAVVNALKVAWNAAWGWIKDTFVTAWNAIFGFAKFIWNAISTYAKIVWNSVKNFFVGTWKAIKDFFVGVWNGIKGFFVNIWNSISSWIINKLNAFWRFWAGVWRGISNFFSGIWRSITNTIHSAWDAIHKWFSDKLNKISQAWSNIWNGMHRVLAGIWNNIKSAVAKGIDGVLGIIQKGIDLINAVLGKLGISWRIPPIRGGLSKAGAAALSQNKPRKGRASGGRMFGPGSTTSDSIYTALSRDEYVIRAKSAREIGYSRLDRLNRLGAKGYASGGRVAGGNSALLDQHRNHVHVAMGGPRMSYPQIIAAAKASHIPFSVGSTYRPGSRAGNGNLDHHSEGRAVDFPGFNQDALASYFSRLGNVIELIHRTASRDYAIFGGKGGGGGGGGLFGWLGRGWNWLLDKMLKPAGQKAKDMIPGGNFIGELGKGAIGGIFNGVVGKVKKEFDEAQATMDSGSAGNWGVTGANLGAARWSSLASRALAMLGLPSSWLQPLLTLIGRESGGNPRAINRTDSNAARGDPSRGLMQTIGATFRAYALPGYNTDIYDPLSNMLAGLRYIRSRYSSIFNVAQANPSHSPQGYDNGGWLPPVNTSGKPEMVLSSAQGAALERNITALGQGYPNIQVFVDGVEVAHRAIVHENNSEIIRTLRAGQK